MLRDTIVHNESYSVAAGVWLTMHYAISRWHIDCCEPSNVPVSQFGVLENGLRRTDGGAFCVFPAKAFPNNDQVQEAHVEHWQNDWPAATGKIQQRICRFISLLAIVTVLT